MTAARQRILITGAGRGLGLATARRLAAAGHDLVVTARSEPATRNVIRWIYDEVPECDVGSVVLDLASLTSVRESAASLCARESKIDVIVHNAGILFPSPTRTLTEDGVEQTLQVHAVAPLLLTALLRPAVSTPARVWIVGSSLHAPGGRGPEVDFRHDDPNLDGRYDPRRAYKNSKLAALWVAYELEQRFAAQGLHADVVSPGFVPTTAAHSAPSWFARAGLRHLLPRMPFATSVEDASEAMARRFAETPRGEAGGRYFKDGEPTASSDQSRDEAQAAAFWTWACARAGLDAETLDPLGD